MHYELITILKIDYFPRKPCFYQGTDDSHLETFTGSDDSGSKYLKSVLVTAA